MTASASRVAQLEHVLAEAVPGIEVVGPDGVAGLDPGTRAAVLAPLSLSRRGRSQRGPGVLDLVLTVLVLPVGPHRLDDLEQLLVGLDRTPGFTVSDAAPQVELLRALGLTPGPSALVCADVPVQLAEERAPLVRQPLVAHIGELHLLRGTVLGPGGVPLPHASVGVRGAEGLVRCASDGTFRLPLLAPVSHVQLVVEVKGRRSWTEVTVHEGLPVTVRYDEGGSA